MNKLATQADIKKPSAIVHNETNNSALTNPMNFDLSYLLEKTNINDSKISQIFEQNNDDVLVDISEDKIEETEKQRETKVDNIKIEKSQEAIFVCSNMRKDVKLSDLQVALDEITPSNVPPVTALEEKNGITVTLHFARDKLRESVTVVVVTIVSKNILPLRNVLFRAIVPKVSKISIYSRYTICMFL